MTTRQLRFMVLVALLAISLSNACLAQFTKESKWIPNGANSVVLVNSQRIFSSPLAQRENWKDGLVGAFARGTLVVPPHINQMIFASQFDLAFMEPIWSVMVLAPQSTDVGVEELAKEWNRSTDSLAGHPALQLPNDVYLVELDDTFYGAMAPADRQSTLRWIEAAEADLKPKPAPYIAEALAFADNNSDIILAFDFHGAIDVDAIRTGLKGSDTVAAADVEEVAKAIGRLRGFMLGINFKDKINAALRVDFEPGTVGLEKLSKRTIIEAIENNGVMIDDVRDWEFASQGNTLMLNGTLSASGLRQMNMLVAQPVQAAFGGIGLTAAKETMADPIVATRRYFDRVELCFKDLDETIRNGTSKTAKAYQRWFSASADQIDMLPSRKVNQEVLELGGRVAESFREISLSLVAADASNSSQSKVLDANRSGGYYYYPYAYGYGYRRPNASKLKAAIRAQNYAAVQVQTTAIMNRVKNDLGDIRRNVKFEK